LNKIKKAQLASDDNWVNSEQFIAVNLIVKTVKKRYREIVEQEDLTEAHL